MSEEAVKSELAELSSHLEALSHRAIEIGEKLGGEPISDHKSAGVRLAHARAKAGMTQAGLSQASGVSTNTIINFEKGYSHPRPATLMKLADAVGIPWEVLQEHEE
jgi:DNA-binding XRE family transcriptional regulator